MGAKRRSSKGLSSQNDTIDSSNALHDGLPDEGGDAAWIELCEQFPHDPRLTSEIIYALPVRLLGLLNRFAPALLTEEDQRFERQLRNLGGTGFRFPGDRELTIVPELMRRESSSRGLTTLHRCMTRFPPKFS